MKTTKQERIEKFARGYMHCMNISRKEHLREVLADIKKENIYNENSKLSVEERTLIASIVKRYA